MKIKSITKEQYITLAQLGMPVYSLHGYLAEDYLLRRLSDPDSQSGEQKNCIEYSQTYTKFVTLVDSE